MGLMGSSSFVRYQVEGELPDNLRDVVAEKVGEFAFRDIDDSYEERSVGLVSIADLLDSDFATLPPVVGDYAMFAIRIDERKVPAATLKKFCQKEEEKAKRKLGVPRLARAQRTEIKENTQLMLLKKAVPEPKSFEVVWNLANGQVFLLSTSGKAQGILEELFPQVFGVRVVREIPLFTAARITGGDAAAEIEPSLFV